MRFLALGTVTLLAGCSATPPALPPPSSTVDLSALHEQYGLPQCPPTDLSATAAPEGLPVTDLACLGTEQRVNLAGLPREPMIINVWAQWCGPCRAEAPYLRAGLAELDGVSFVGINYNDPLPDWAIEFAGLAGWDYPHIQDQDKTLQASLKVPGVPTSYFVSAEGRVIYTHAGPFNSTEELLGLAREHLAIR